jgi:hypothetical protein
MKVWRKTQSHSEGKFLVVRRDGSVPHWPHFVLGGRDPFAPIALRAYADAIASLDLEYARSVRELADDFNAYRLDQGNGDPDAPPHRKDDSHVIAAMRGNATMIAVRPDKGNTPKFPAGLADQTGETR